MNDLPISSILQQYDTDKAREHNYGAAYDALFSAFDRAAPLNILEIGVQKGGSLCAWQDYFPNATITGVDILDSVLPEYRREGITYVLSDIREWNTDQTFDIIIDDGSHYADDVRFVVETFPRKLRRGGILIVEDIQDMSLWKDYELIDLRGNYDDVLLIIQA